MPKRRIATVAAALAVTLTGVSAPPAAAASGDREAKSLCRERLSRAYDASASDIFADERGRDRYWVTGTAKRDRETGRFTCSVEFGRVAFLNATDWRKSGGGGGGGGTAAAIGGAIALAAIIAAASAKNKDRDRDRDRDRYDDRYERDSYSPSADITCYRNQRACYGSYDHRYSARWTQREFGY